MLRGMAVAMPPTTQRRGAPTPLPVAATLRVTMTIGSFRPVLGGAQRQLEQLGPLLRERGIRTTVLTRRPPAGGVPRRATIAGLDVVRLPVPDAAGPASLAYTAGGAAWLAAHPTEVLHAHGLLSATTLALIGGAARRRPIVAKPLSCGPHGDLARLLTKPAGPRRLELMARRVAAFVCVSGEIERELADHGIPASRLVRIANGVDAQRFRPAGVDDGPAAERRAALGLPADGPLLVSCARFDRTKRLERLVAAQAQLPGTLVLAGEGPEREALVAAARAAGVADRVVLLPTVADPAPLLRLADVYLTCSAQDGLPNAVLEAMASGLPVVAAPAGGITELVDDETGIVLGSPSAGELAQAAMALLSDDGRRRRLGQAARRRVVQRYSLAMTADRLAELYRRVGA